MEAYGAVAGDRALPAEPASSAASPPRSKWLRAGGFALAASAGVLFVAASATSAPAPARATTATAGLHEKPGRGTYKARAATDKEAALSSFSGHEGKIYMPKLVTEYISLFAPDGVQSRAFYSYNKGLQGPTMRVPLNATIVQTLENALYSDTTTLHHHGVHQIGTPYNDGTMNIAQPGVQPGRSMAYEFKAWPKGTHWYHSHSALQFGDGLKGLFIVEDPDDPWRDYYAVDDGLLFYEWNGEASEAMYVEKIFAPDSPQTFQEGLVNGVVSVNRTGAESAGYVVNVGAGRTARLRLCYGGFNYKFAVSVQGHNMTIIAKDGTYVRPVTVERIVMHAAERYDVLVTADQGVGDFSIDFEATIHGSQKEQDDYTPDGLYYYHNETLYQGHMNATLRVGAIADGAGGGDDDDLAARANHTSKRLPRDTPYQRSLDLGVDTTGLRTHVEHEAVTPPATAHRELPLVVTARFPYQQKGKYTKKYATGSSPTGAWFFNNNSWVDPTAPLYLSKGDCCISTERHYETYVVDVAYDEVIDIVVAQNGGGSTPETHPVHFHGYKFWVIGSGRLPYPGSAAAVPNLNLVDPIYADTFPVRTGYYYVMRFQASNPGMWHFHCHLLYHMYLGLQLVFNVAEEMQPEPSDEYYLGLESWPGELSGLLKGSKSDDGTKKR